MKKRKMSKKGQHLNTKNLFGNKIAPVNIYGINFLKIKSVPLVQNDLAELYDILYKSYDPLSAEKDAYYSLLSEYYSPFFSKLFPYISEQSEPTNEPVADIASKLCPIKRDYSAILPIKLLQWIDIENDVDGLIKSADPCKVAFADKIASLLNQGVDQTKVIIRNEKEILYDVAELRFY